MQAEKMQRRIPYGLLVLLAIAAPLCGPVLDLAADPQVGGGEASLGAAYEALFLTFGLWILLAAFTGLDMCSRHMPWAIVFPAAFPALIAFYALWSRFPRWQRALPAEPTSALVWGAIFFLSVLSFALAA